MGMSSRTIVDGTVCEPGSPLWASYLTLIATLPGISICAFAYWRARRRPNNLAWVFTYGAAFFWLMLRADKLQPEPDDPTFQSLILVTVTMAVIAVLFDVRFLRGPPWPERAELRQLPNSRETLSSFSVELLALYRSVRISAIAKPVSGLPVMGQVGSRGEPLTPNWSGPRQSSCRVQALPRTRCPDAIADRRFPFPRHLRLR
jgi:hypothetical protein